MKLPRPRITVRRLMVAVAIVGMLLWGGMLAVRSITYAFWAGGVAKKRDAYQADILALEGRAAKGPTAKEAELLAFGHRMMEYLARQQARYENAARYPWLSVEPDPPMPK
jgi:hypothetical protein